MSNHHNHPSHVHNFINKHTAPALLLLIIGCFIAGYYLGIEHTRVGMNQDRHDTNEYRGYNVGGDRINFDAE